MLSTPSKSVITDIVDPFHQGHIAGQNNANSAPTAVPIAPEQQEETSLVEKSIQIEESERVDEDLNDQVNNTILMPNISISARIRLQKSKGPRSSIISVPKKKDSNFVWS
ncbi:hypothetical protein QQ045_001277 [Rhodiola kirilowii]